MTTAIRNTLPGSPRFGTELVTFYHPQFWGTHTVDEMMEHCRSNPERMWTKILDSLQEAGVDTFEMTVAPAGQQSVLSVFGTPNAFAAELKSRGLTMRSAFFFILSWPYGVGPVQAIEEITDYARFVAACGGEVVVAGPPMRLDRRAPEPLFVDLQYLNALAGLLNLAGRSLLDEGVTLAIHNEAHSVVSYERDIDFLMMLTDPDFVSLCLDSGNLTVAGGDPVATASRHRARIAAAHWKDAIGAMPADILVDETIHDRHRDYFCEVGAGHVDWEGFAAQLQGTPAGDPIIFELDAAPDPVAAIRTARETITELFHPAPSA
jgi:sugar phosphate isomerase/epimerase